LIFPSAIRSGSATHVEGTHAADAPVDAWTLAADTMKPTGIPIFARSAERLGDVFVSSMVYDVNVDGLTAGGLAVAV